MKRINAIYARQSVDRVDSISIDSQIEFCRFEVKDAEFKVYRDRGYSGKNTMRPQLQELFSDIRRGEIDKVIVYKLDRISRSILDFSNMMEMFQQHQVEFVSSTEKFDTSTPMGRAMLNICIVFAQLERETIQKRVSDAYYSRSKKGFRMGGKPPYGFRLEEIIMDGIHTKKLVPEPEEAAIVQEIFDMYAEPETSYGDITRYYAEKGVLFYEKELIRPMLAQLLRNPVYVKADWAAGNIKCGICGYALMSIKSPSKRQYLRCSKRLNNRSCPGCGKIYTKEVEDYVFRCMVQKARETHVAKELERAADCMGKWESTPFQEKRFVLDKMVSIIKVSPGAISIEWKL